MLFVINTVVLFTAAVYLILSTIKIGDCIAHKEVYLNFFVGEVVLSLLSILISIFFRYPLNLIILFLMLLPFFILEARALRFPKLKSNKSILPSNLLYSLILFALLGLNFIRSLERPYTWDDVAYHFPAVKEIATGNVRFPLFSTSPYLDFQVFFSKFYGNLPYGSESFASIFYLFSLQNMSAVNLLYFINFVFFLGFLYEFMRKRELFDFPSVIVTLISILTCVDILNLISVGYVDINVVIFQVIGLLLSVTAVREKSWNMLYLSVFLTFYTVSLKYTSVYMMIPYCLMVLYFIFKNRKVKNLSLKFFYISIVATTSGGFWYIKNLILYKNPVYPFYFGHDGFSSSEYAMLLHQIYSPIKQSLLEILKSTYMSQPILIFAVIGLVFMIMTRKMKSNSYQFVLVLFGAFIYLVNYIFGNRESRFVILLPFALAFSLGKILNGKKYWVQLIIFLNIYFIFTIPAQHAIWFSIANDVGLVLKNKIGQLEFNKVGCASNVVEYLDGKGKSFNFWDPYAAMYYEDKNVFVKFNGKINYENFKTPENIRYLYVNEQMKKSFVENLKFHENIAPLERLSLEEILLNNGYLVYESGSCKLYKIN